MYAPLYLLGLFVPLLALATLFLGGAWTFVTPLFVFGVLPLIELVLPEQTRNLTPEEEKAVSGRRYYDAVLYSTVPLHLTIMASFIYLVTTGALAGWSLFGGVLTAGMSCGVLGINAAHELGHRRKTYEQNMAKVLLWSTLYLHFFIEHNRGHHATVATEDDPASARFGETLYAFLPRTMLGSYMDAWRLERERLEKRGARVWTWQNEMVRFQVYQLALLGGLALAFGWVMMLAYMGAAFVGALLLENVNYIEHYGLRRAQRPDGTWERTLPIHSWNSDHPLGRLFLFELTRHSDHHANARRPYPVLRHFDESPQLPTGYPGMMALAWFPPLFFFVMHRHMRRQGERIESMGGRTALATVE